MGLALIRMEEFEPIKLIRTPGLMRGAAGLGRP